MSLTPERLVDLSQGFVTYLRVRSRLVSPPRQPTQRELRRVTIWVGLFSVNPRSLADLARRLSGERRIPRQQGQMSRRDDLENLLSGQNRSLQQHDDPGLQQQALESTPESIYESVAAQLADPNLQASLGLTSPIDSNDALALSLVKWFKSSYMNWVDPIKCAYCGGNTEMVGLETGEGRTEEEKRGGAGNVEVRRCVEGNGGTGCGGERTRFPRYNNLSALLSSRRGRCGEFANLFHLFLLAHALPSRYILSTEDHVWNAYYSSSQHRWIHLDSCEGSFDQPLLYEKGWGKKLTYCFAIGREGVRDVTRGYVDDWETCLSRRTRWSEEEVKATCLRLTSTKRSSMDIASTSAALLRDEQETLDLLDGAVRLARTHARDGKLSGRTSGPDDWRRARDEAGLDEEESPRPRSTTDEEVLFSLRSQTTDMDMCLSGSATLIGSPSKLSLTPCTTSHSGAAAIFLSRPVGILLAIDFAFHIRKQDANGDGADGMALVIMRGDRLASVGGGGNGYGMGYDGLGQKGDFAVEIDTYRSQDTCNDPPTPHISLHSPPLAHHQNSLACTSADSIPDIADGMEHGLRVEVDLAKGEATAWLSIPAQKPADGISLTSTLPSEWLHLWTTLVPGFCHPTDNETSLTIALTAATGGLAQAHDVTEWKISSTSRAASIS